MSIYLIFVIEIISKLYVSDYLLAESEEIFIVSSLTLSFLSPQEIKKTKARILINNRRIY